jgi:hypothetical protein
MTGSAHNVIVVSACGAGRAAKISPLAALVDRRAELVRGAAADVSWCARSSHTAADDVTHRAAQGDRLTEGSAPSADDMHDPSASVALLAECVSTATEYLSRPPCTGHALPRTSHPLPISSHSLPTTDHCLPTTDHSSPSSCLSSPITSHSLPTMLTALPLSARPLRRAEQIRRRRHHDPDHRSITSATATDAHGGLFLCRVHGQTGKSTMRDRLRREQMAPIAGTARVENFASAPVR